MTLGNVLFSFVINEKKEIMHDILKESGITRETWRKINTIDGSKFLLN